MKPTKEQIDATVKYWREHSTVNRNDGRVIVALADELLALRKVADAAAVIMMAALRGDGATYHRNMPEYDSLYDALKESGQWR